MINQRKAGAVLQYLQMGLNVIIGLIYTPIMIRLLGSSEYGLYNTVSSTISMLSILSMGFNSGYIRYYAQYKKEKNNQAIASLNGLFIFIFTILGFIALICGLFLSEHLNLVFADGLTDSEYGIARVLMILLTLNLSVSFPMGVFSHIISAHERFIYLKVLGMIRTVVSPLITLPLLLAGYRSIAMVSVTVSVSLFVDLLYCFYAFKILRIKIVFFPIPKELFKSLFLYTSFIAINLIVDQVNWNIDKILLGRYQGTSAVAVYAVASTLQNYYQIFSTSVSSVFTPKIHKIINDTKDNIKEQKKVLTELFIKVGRIQFLILSLIATGLIFWGKKFIIQYWAGSGYEQSYYVMLLLILPSTIALIENLGIEIQRAENKHQFRSIVYLFMAFVNLILSIFLCQLYGAVGAAIGTTISLVLANGLIMNIYYHRKCNINIIIFWKNILSLTKGLIIPIILAIVMTVVVKSDSLLIFLLEIIIYIIVYAISMWFFGMNRYEKDLVLEPLNKICKNRR